MDVQGIVEVVRRADKDIKDMVRNPSRITHETLSTLALRLSSSNEIDLDYGLYLLDWLATKGNINFDSVRLLADNKIRGKINSVVWHNITRALSTSRNPSISIEKKTDRIKRLLRSKPGTEPERMFKEDLADEIIRNLR